MVSKGKVMPDPMKVKKIREYERPTNIKELRSFLGLCNYVRCFIGNYSKIVAPLNNLLKGETKKSIKKITWNEINNNAFIHIRNTKANITYRTQPDITKEFILTTDASDYAYGAVLAQVNDDGKEEMIATFSKSMDSAQKLLFSYRKRTSRHCKKCRTFSTLSYMKAIFTSYRP